MGNTRWKKIRIEYIFPEEAMYYMALEIKFASGLNGNTINENTCLVKNEKGETLNCRLKYNEQNRSIQVLTNEKHNDNSNYYLVISDAVKTQDGGTMGKECQIRFKILNENLIEQLTLRGRQCKQFQTERPEGTKKEKEVKKVLPEIDRKYTVALQHKKRLPSYAYIAYFSLFSILFVAVYCLKRFFL